MVEVWAINKLTKEKLLLGYCDTKEEAQEDIDSNIEWDELDNSNDWSFEIKSVKGYEESVDIDDDWDFVDYSYEENVLDNTIWEEISEEEYWEERSYW